MEAVPTAHSSTQCAVGLDTRTLDHQQKVACACDVTFPAPFSGKKVMTLD